MPIDCPAPISDVAAAELLETYRDSATLLPDLRYWVATLRVSDLVLADSRKSATGLIRELDAARSR